MAERSIFLTALDLGDAAARADYLDHACAGDPALRGRVEALLAAHADSGSFMGRPAPDLDPPGDTTAPHVVTPVDAGQHGAGDLAGAVLAGRYELVRELGSGGMGTVYLAEQLRPVRRRVAVKLVRAGMDTRAVLARFDAERQALAVMDHPNIAKVLDAGETDRGRPFFAMELVDGLPITDYCDAHALPVAGRLALFGAVCRAVQHAHQKGVIHRDLKPSNVLVETRDGAAVPKVIDFGLAKAFGNAALTEHSLLTAPGAVAGTPLYMAPEQAGPDGRDIDTRADVYALGAILYELLTGTTPLGRDTLRRAALDEVLRAVREHEPPTPSSRLAAADSTPSAAANRSTEPGRLGRLVRGDLDWVVMKALEKDRGRRYDSAAAFAADVDRFLNHEPVTAGPPSARYRAGKFVRRNRAAVVAASLVLLSLVAGVAGTTAGLVRAERRRAEAEANLAYAKKGNEILGLVFAGLDPKRIADSGRPLQDVLRENLQTAARELDGSAIGDQLAVAEMQDTLGTSLAALGEYGPATALLEKARSARSARLGPTHPGTISSMNNLGEVYRAAGRLDRAVPLLEETLALMRAELGPDHRDTLSCMNNLGLAYQEGGRADRAVALWEETLALRQAKLGRDDADTLVTMNCLADGYLDLGRTSRAVALWEETLALRKAKLGPDHPHTLNTMNNLGNAYGGAGRGDRRLSILDETLKLSKAKLGRDHPDTLVTMNNLGNAYRDAGRLDEALALHEEALRLMRVKFGDDHATTLRCLSNVAGDHWAARRYDRAVPLLEESLALRQAKLGPGHTDSLAAMSRLASAYVSRGRLDRAIPLYEQAVPLMEKHHGRPHPATQTAVGGLGIAYLNADRVADALPMLEEAYRTGRTAPALRSVGWYLLDGYAKAGKRDEPAKLIPELVAQARESLPKGSPELAGKFAECSLMLLRLGAYADAEPLLREGLAIREKTQPDKWGTFNMQSQLGGALLGQGKYAEAEPLLLRGYAGMKRRRDAIPPQGRDRLPEAAERLIELYAATKKPAEAAKWRAERALYPPELAPPPRPSSR